MVKIKKAEYILSAAWKSQWPKESFPEMCLAGRSNVEKVVLLMRCYLEMVLQKYQVRQVKQEL